MNASIPSQLRDTSEEQGLRLNRHCADTGPLIRRTPKTEEIPPRRFGFIVVNPLERQTRLQGSRTRPQRQDADKREKKLKQENMFARKEKRVSSLDLSIDICSDVWCVEVTLNRAHVSRTVIGEERRHAPQETPRGPAKVLESFEESVASWQS